MMKQHLKTLLDMHVNIPGANNDGVIIHAAASMTCIQSWIDEGMEDRTESDAMKDLIRDHALCDRIHETMEQIAMDTMR